MWLDFLEHPKKSVLYLQLLCRRKEDGGSNYWGDSLTGEVTGSRLWTLRQNLDFAKAKLFAKEALEDEAFEISTHFKQGELRLSIQTKEGVFYAASHS